MGLRRRLNALEGQITVPEDELRLQAEREFRKRLTYEESEWLYAPISEAEMLVTCPIHGGKCACTNEPRRRRAFEEHPDLCEEFGRRWLVLYERREEILAREPEDFATSWRRRHGISAQTSGPAGGLHEHRGETGQLVAGAGSLPGPPVRGPLPRAWDGAASADQEPRGDL